MESFREIYDNNRMSLKESQDKDNCGLVAIQNLTNKPYEEIKSLAGVWFNKENTGLKYLAQIKIGKDTHAISYVNNKFENTFRLTRNKIRYISEWK